MMRKDEIKPVLRYVATCSILFLLCICLNSITGKAAESDFDLSNDGTWLFHYYGHDKDVVIPDGVKQIDDKCFSQNKEIESVVFPDGVERIRQEAFSGCDNLKKVTMTDSMLRIDQQAFYECVKLSVDKFPKNLQEIDNNAFYHCNGIVKVELSNTIQYMSAFAFEACENLQEINIEEGAENHFTDNGILYDRNYLGSKYPTLRFCPLAKEGELMIPAYVKRIEARSFAGCNKLTNIVLPNGLEQIGSQAFRECNGLTSIYIPKTTEKIGSAMFAKCKNLTDIRIDSENKVWCSEDSSIYTKGKEYLAEYPYYKEGTAVIPESVTRIELYAFYECDKVTNVVLPSKLNRIDEYAFYDCTNLKKIEMPDTVTLLEWNVFENCTSLEEVKLSDKIRELDQQVFKNCTNLKKVKFPKDLVVIYMEAFKDCVNLDNVEFGESLKTIKEWAFYNCASLKNLKLPDSLVEMNSSFTDCISLEEVKFGKNIKSVCGTFYGCYNLENYSVSSENPYITCVDGSVYSKDMKTFEEIPDGKSGSYIMPESVTSCYTYAFEGSKKLTDITISSNMEKLEDTYFSSCKELKTLTILGKNTKIRSCRLPEQPFTIYGYRGSDAERLAEYNDKITFIALDDSKDEPKPGESSQPSETPKPEESQAPVVTPEPQKPVITGNPVVTPTKQPVITSQPVVTNKVPVTTYQITYVLDKGTNGENPTQAPSGTVIKLNNPLRKGYVFSGWYLDKKFKQKVSGSLTVTSNITVYAKWSKIKVGQVKLMSAKNVKSKKLKVSWKKQKAVTGYQIQFNKKSKTVKGTGVTVAKLQKGKTYTVVVRAYITDSTGNRVYGKWSIKKKVKIKK